MGSILGSPDFGKLPKSPSPPPLPSFAQALMVALQAMAFAATFARAMVDSNEAWGRWRGLGLSDSGAEGVGFRRTNRGIYPHKPSLL